MILDYIKNYNNIIIGLMSPDADMDIWTSLTVMMFAYILGPIVFGISGLFLSAIVLVLLTHYFMIVVPRLTQDLSRDQGMSEVPK